MRALVVNLFAIKVYLTVSAKSGHRISHSMQRLQACKSTMTGKLSFMIKTCFGQNSAQIAQPLHQVSMMIISGNEVLREHLSISGAGAVCKSGMVDFP
jgi:hypothetical protein